MGLDHHQRPGTNSGAAAVPREPAINSSIATPKWSFAASVTPVAWDNVDNIAPAEYIAHRVLHSVLNPTPWANWLSADNRLIGRQPRARRCRQLKGTETFYDRADDRASARSGGSIEPGSSYFHSRIQSSGPSLPCSHSSPITATLAKLPT